MITIKNKSGAEMEERAVDFVVQETLLARVGQDAANFEVILEDEEFELWTERMAIRSAMAGKQFDIVQEKVEAYRRENAHKHKLHEQFCLYYEIKLAEWRGEAAEDICRLAEKALAFTKRIDEQPEIKESLYTPMELDLLLTLLQHRYQVWENPWKREQCLRKMKGEADDNVLTKQYLTRAEAVLDYTQGRIRPEEMLERIDKAIRMTVPDYEKYLNQEKIFPFVQEELLALMSMGNAYRSIGEKERGMQMYEAVLSCLNADYIGEPDKTSMQVLVKYDIVRAHAELGNHKEALKEIDTCLYMCRERDYSHMLAPLLFSKAHCCVRLVVRGGNGGKSSWRAKESSM